MTVLAVPQLLIALLCLGNCADVTVTADTLTGDDVKTGLTGCSEKRKGEFVFRLLQGFHLVRCSDLR